MIDINTPIPHLRPLELHPVEENGRQYYILRDPSGFSDKSIALSAEVIPVLSSFDNNKTLLDIASEISEAVGEHQDPAELIPLIDLLDELYFLQNERFEEYRKQKVEAFAKLKVRDSVLAGIGFPSEPEDLKSFLNALLQTDDPEDFEPEKPEKKMQLKGYLAPHIDYQRGGESYGRLYRKLNPYFEELKDQKPLFVLFGVAHAGAVAPITLTGKDFQTPYGTVHNNRKSYDYILKHMGNKAIREEWLHKNEHSIELQVIWLKHLMGDSDFSILPVLVSMWDVDGEANIRKDTYFAKIVEIFKSVEKLHKGPVIYIASVDFAHIGPAFGDTDLISENDVSIVEKIDMEALKAIRKVDSDLWWKTVNRFDNPNRICGLNATAIAMELLRGAKGFVVDYQKSISQDKNLMVTYASSMFFDID